MLATLAWYRSLHIVVLILVYTSRNIKVVSRGLFGPEKSDLHVLYR